MANKRSELPPDIQEIGAILGQLATESDRGAALIAAALVDDSLGHHIRSHFVDDPAAVRELMIGDAPLGTFSSKIKLAYCIGWIGKRLRRDLDLIRNIRNEFAHDRSGVTFETPAIRDRCREFHAVEVHNSFTQVNVTAPRNAFLIACSFVSGYFIGFTKAENRPKENTDDGFDLYVKNATEQIDLAMVAKLMAQREELVQSSG